MKYKEITLNFIIKLKLNKQQITNKFTKHHGPLLLEGTDIGWEALLITCSKIPNNVVHSLEVG